MRKTIAAALAALTFTGALATAAEAHDRNYRHRHNNKDGAAVAAGIAGLAIGAALASGGRDRGYYDNSYDRGYYGRGYYNDRRYYGRPHYGPPVRYGYYDNRRYRQRCETVRRWDPYYGGYVRVRRCW